MRRSALDSWLLGCIPVFFLRPEQFAGYLPDHYAGWAANASVLIPPEPFLRGEVDLIGRLAALSKARVRKMQALIGHNAHRLVYGLDPVEGDAIDVFLGALLERKRRSSWIRG